MKKCIKCGREAESNFCPDCGTAMSDIPEGPGNNSLDETRSYETGTSTYRFTTDSDTAENFRNNGYKINAEKEGVSGRTWFIILFLVIFWPVGLALMWSKKKFNIAARTIITVIIALLVALNVVFIFIKNDDHYYYGSGQTNTVIDPSFENTSLGHENALKAAKTYLDIMPFSYNGLIDQLKYDGYTSDEAIYAADNCNADWNQQAKLQAESYLDLMPFSKQELIDQLEYDGFSSEQAQYTVKAVGY